MSTASVVVLDYGSGNLRSVQRALARVGARVTVTADIAAAAQADGLVVPGVGAYAACMAGLEALDARSLVRGRIAAGRPVLGICVGMQVMFTRGVEHGVESAGLDVLSGTVERVRAPILPHMGWNTVLAPAGSVLFAEMDADARFYFVHSYAAHVTDELTAAALVTTSVHGVPFVAAAEAGPLSVTQFHPEKSGDAGADLLRNWLATL